MRKGTIFLFLVFILSQIYAVDLNKALPQDPTVRIGKLSNGLTYYLKQNKTPEKKAELRLAVNVGSILEDEDQKGMAHFCEHMAFNGTKNFPKAELTDYLGSIGMGFAGGLNAGTGIEQTVYMLESGTTDKAQLKKAVFILSEWAHNVSYDTEEIEKERGVIIEEWRGGRGADERINKKQMEVILQGSKYASHTPIGTYEVLSTFKPETLRKFYKDWYRPDLQAVVIVGDINPEEVESYIKEYFDKIPMPINPRVRTIENVPDHNDTRISIVGDKEANSTNISIMIKSDLKKTQTIGDYKNDLTANLFYQMFNLRLAEIAKNENPPFLYAYAYKYPLTKTKSSIFFSAGTKDNESLKGLEAIATEKERIDKFGFTQTELDRAKLQILRVTEQRKLESDKQPSNRLIWPLVSNYLDQRPMIDENQNYQLTSELLPTISLEEVNTMIKGFASEANRVITLSYPEKEGTIAPKEDELLAVLKKVEGLELKPYQDNIITTPLVKVKPVPGKIISKKYNKTADLYELYLSNGAKVIYKKTDFKNNEIAFRAFSLGGMTQINDTLAFSHDLASSLIAMSGLGDYNMINLSKYLSGHLVEIYPEIDINTEQLDGQFSPSDTELAMQLIYSYYTQPRKDPEAFKNLMNNMEAMLQNKYSDPESIYQDSVNAVKYNYNQRMKSIDQEDLKKLNLDALYMMYKDRFSDASDFTFTFVGAIEEASFEKFIEEYIASLPSTYRKEKIEDRNVRYSKGIIDKNIFSGQEEKSIINIMLPSEYRFNKKNNTTLNAMITVFNEKLRENIREKMSGVYYIYAYPVPNKYPNSDLLINIVLGCSPARVEELTKAINKEMDLMKTQACDDKYLQIYKQTTINSWSDDIKKNEYWLRNIQNYQTNDLNFNDFVNTLKFVNKVKAKDIQKMAQQALNYDVNRMNIVLYPERKTN